MKKHQSAFNKLIPNVTEVLVYDEAISTEEFAEMPPHQGGLFVGFTHESRLIIVMEMEDERNILKIVDMNRVEIL